MSCCDMSFKGPSDCCVKGLIAPIGPICVSTADPPIFRLDVVSFEWHQTDVWPVSPESDPLTACILNLELNIDYILMAWHRFILDVTVSHCWCGKITWAKSRPMTNKKTGPVNFQICQLSNKYTDFILIWIFGFPWRGCLMLFRAFWLIYIVKDFSMLNMQKKQKKNSSAVFGKTRDSVSVFCDKTKN